MSEEEEDWSYDDEEEEEVEFPLASPQGQRMEPVISQMPEPHFDVRSKEDEMERLKEIGEHEGEALRFYKSTD
jgi:hypothetical protein